MSNLKYTVIKTKTQYREYCRMLEILIGNGSNPKAADEIELLTVLIEKWDRDHNTLHAVDPIRLLHSLMEDHHMKASDLVKMLNVSKGYISDILHYKKGLSKEMIRNLSAHFKVAQEAFNRPYKLRKEPVRKVLSLR